jgi:hypothetical protein
MLFKLSDAPARQTTHHIDERFSIGTRNFGCDVPSNRLIYRFQDSGDQRGEAAVIIGRHGRSLCSVAVEHGIENPSQAVQEALTEECSGTCDQYVPGKTRFECHATALYH